MDAVLKDHGLLYKLNINPKAKKLISEIRHVIMLEKEIRL
jgi:hypothetical protein